MIEPLLPKAGSTVLVFFFFLTASAIYPQQNWRQATQDLTVARPDLLDQQSRAARDMFFDAHIGANSPLDRPGNIPSINSVWERVGATPAIITSDDAVALVNFSTFNCVVSRSKRSIYTEVSMIVEDILKDTTGTLQRQGTISVLLPGGKVRFPSGKTVAWDVKDNNHEIQPNGRYLIFITYVKDGAFFL